MSETSLPRRKVHGRRFGRPMKPERAGVLETLLPKLHVDKALVEARKIVPLEQIFGVVPKKLTFEVGFGNGEHVIGLMQREPETHFFGAEPFVNGMAALLKSIKDNDIPHDNLRVWMDNAIDLMDILPDSCVDEIYVLNPDPWPKARHFKRRIISQPNLTTFARIMKPGALLVMTSDVDDLSEWMYEEADAHPEFIRDPARGDDFRTKPEDWIETRYEQKGKAAGRVQSYLYYRRK